LSLLRDPLAQNVHAVVDELSPTLRREFRLGLEAVIFASPKAVPRETLAVLVGSDCNLDELMDPRGAARAPLRPRRGRPVEDVFDTGSGLICGLRGELALRGRLAYARSHVFRHILGKSGRALAALLR
jgi:hypothetical protein